MDIEHCYYSLIADIVEFEEGNVEETVVAIDGGGTDSAVELVEHCVVPAQILVQDVFEDSVLSQFADQENLFFLVYFESSGICQVSETQTSEFLILRANYKNTSKSIFYRRLLEWPRICEVNVFQLSDWLLVKGPILIECGPRRAWLLNSLTILCTWISEFQVCKKMDWFAKSEMRKAFSASLKARDEGCPRMVNTTSRSPFLLSLRTLPSSDTQQIYSSTQMGEVSLLLYLMIARHSSNFYTCTLLYIPKYYKQLHN